MRRRNEMVKEKPKRVKHVPMRTCLGTGEKRPKRDLVRIVRTEEGRIVVDETGKRSGSRGAYLSRSLAAAQLAIQRKKLEHEFEQPVSAEDAQALLAYFSRFG